MNESEHGLRVQLATALRERDEARHGLDEWCRAAMQERAEVKRLREMLNECVRIIDKMASNSARGRTWEIAQEVLLMARAALAAPAAGEDGKQ